MLGIMMSYNVTFWNYNMPVCISRAWKVSILSLWNLHIHSYQINGICPASPSAYSRRNERPQTEHRHPTLTDTGGSPAVANTQRSQCIRPSRPTGDGGLVQTMQFKLWIRPLGLNRGCCFHEAIASDKLLNLHCILILKTRKLVLLSFHSYCQE